MGDITVLIRRARDGDSHALGSLFELLYPELRRIARVRLRHGLRDTGRLSATDRVHFFAYVATAMRSIVVDEALNQIGALDGAARLAESTLAARRRPALTAAWRS